MTEPERIRHKLAILREWRAHGSRGPGGLYVSFGMGWPPPLRFRAYKFLLGLSGIHWRHRRAVEKVLRSDINHAWRALAYVADTGPAQVRRIQEWNRAYANDVQEDVTETMMDAIPPLRGESPEEYRNRLRSIENGWRKRRARTLYPPTPAGPGARGSRGPPAFRQSARKGGRRSG